MGVALWRVLQKIITLYVFCRIYEEKLMEKEDMPSLRETLKAGWKNLLRPVIILLPFILDHFFKETFFTARLGAGATNLSSSLLLFTPGLVAVYALAVSKERTSIKKLVDILRTSVTSIVPVTSTIFFIYCISSLFSATDVGVKIGEFIQGWNLSIVVLTFIIPLITVILGMVLP